MTSRLVLALIGGSLVLQLAAPARAQPAPADVVVVVDSSGSMSAEASMVQQSLNAFTSTLEAAGVSPRIIAIADDSSDASGLCVPAPLGSGSCPDDANPPAYVHLVESVGSNAALEAILEQHPSFQGFLRPTGAKAIVVVSDDDSSLSAEAFDLQIVAVDPTFADYRFHAIAADYDPFAPTDPCRLLASDAGEEYFTLVALRGGTFHNLCEPDFDAAFDAIAADVVAQVPEPTTAPLALGAVATLLSIRRGHLT
jgi:hypothetical protein